MNQYEVQIQSLVVKSYLVKAETREEVLQLYKREGLIGIVRKADEVRHSDDNEELLSISLTD